MKTARHGSADPAARAHNTRHLRPLVPTLQQLLHSLPPSSISGTTKTYLGLRNNRPHLMHTSPNFILRSPLAYFGENKR